MNRARFLAAAAAASLAGGARPALAQGAAFLDVAYAGSMGAMMEGPIAAGAASALSVTLHGRGMGSDALANLIAGGSILPDVFIPVTPGPMETVLRAGKARAARPVARTEMVIAYSARGRFAAQFAAAAAAARGALPWWKVLQQPGLRFGRTDPLTDPQGRNIIFTLQLAEAHYGQPGLARAILGDTINPAQIFSEPTVAARLQSGELDAASAYKIQPGPFDVPYLRLPAEINLGDAALRPRYARARLELGGTVYHPQPLVYYAAAIEGAAHRERADAFIAWLAGDAQPIFRRFFYDPPGSAAALHA